jgi:hypothetical protein
VLACLLLKRMTEVRIRVGDWEPISRRGSALESVVREAVDRVAVKGAPGAAAALSGAR